MTSELLKEAADVWNVALDNWPYTGHPHDCICYDCEVYHKARATLAKIDAALKDNENG